MAGLAQLTLFFAITMALVFSSSCQSKTDYSQPCTGGPNDMATDCGSQCPLTCENPNPRPCILSCKLNACECQRGFVRRSDGMCVTKEECQNSSEEEEAY